MKALRILLALSICVALAPAAPAQRRSTRKPRRTPKTAAPAAATPAAVTTPSGLTYVITHNANGRRPKAGEYVLVHYTGMLTNGTKFDSSYDRNDPIAFPLGQGKVIKGWDEGIAKLGVGDHAVLVIPPDLAYGERGAGGVIPPNSTLVFLVDLVDVKDATLSQVLSKIIAERGVNTAIAEYRKMKAQGFGEIYVSESELNGLGYELMRQRRFKDAIEILKLNVDAYPKSGNAYDSLGEAYMLDGNKELAIENYKKSLELDPKNANAAEMLEKLRAQ